MGVRLPHAGPNKIMKIVPNIWNSFEMYCISRDFPYEAYLDMHIDEKLAHGVISEAFYDLIRRGFHTQMEQDLYQSVV